MSLCRDRRLRLPHGTTSRDMGDMKDPVALADFLAAQKLPHERMLFLRQAHTTGIIELPDENAVKSYVSGPPRQADAWLLAAGNCGVAIHTADCVPLLLWDDDARFVALAHCGWQGVAAGLPLKTGRAVRAAAGQRARINAWLGPHIMPCCFETAEDVASKFPASAAITRGGSKYIDLAAETRRQLLQAGLEGGDIACAGLCTKCRNDRFFSFRGETTPRRMMTFVFKEAL